MSTTDLTQGAQWRRLLSMLPLTAAMVLGGPVACDTPEPLKPNPDDFITPRHRLDAGTDPGTDPDANAGDPCEPSAEQAAAAIKSGWPLTSETSAVGASDEVYADGYVHTAEFASLAGGSFHYLDLEAGAFANVSDVESVASPAWQVAIRRTDLRVNSSTSGPGSIKIARLTDMRFADVQTIPEDLDWAQDDVEWELVEGENGALSCGVVGSRGKPYVAINAINQDRPLSGSWYHYNLSTHQVSTYRNTVYLVQDDAGSTWKLEISNYGPGEGGAVNVQVRWAKLFNEVCDATVAAGSTDVDTYVNSMMGRFSTVYDYATNGQVSSSDEVGGLWTATVQAGTGGGALSPVAAFTYLDLDSGDIRYLSDFDAAADANWEIAFRRTSVRFNGGHSGPGHLRVARLNRGDVPVSSEGVSIFDDVKLAHAQGNVTWGSDAALFDWTPGLDDDENEIQVCEYVPTGFLPGPLLTTGYLNQDNDSSGDWYNYTSPITPVPDTVYVLHDTERNVYWKFQWASYYAASAAEDAKRPVRHEVRWTRLTN